MYVPGFTIIFPFVLGASFRIGWLEGIDGEGVADGDNTGVCAFEILAMVKNKIETNGRIICMYATLGF